LVKGRERCTLLMHPQDMAQRGINDGDRVQLSSRAGSVTVPAETCSGVMPGVVSLPHGYGHNRVGIRLQTAAQHAGASCNDVTDDLALDALSGNAAVNGVEVEVALA
ncbi:MAG TPA: dehydrogenase, partial [Halieaceae bacterium]|nr:dehydrogenase [Halieaceae bacterium]